MPITRLARTSFVLIAVSLLCTSSISAQPGPRGGRWLEIEKQGLAQPFKGVTSDGKVVPGLFEIRATGVSTAPIAEAAGAFLASLTQAQQGKATFPVESDEWRKWGNVHSYARDGISFEDLNEKQREAAYALFRASLSAKGVKKTLDVMKLNETLAELTGRASEYSRWMYYLSILGEPSTTQPWGWQLDGHHCIINFFVLGDQVVMAPVFLGSEPVRAVSGKYKGTTIMQDEQNLGLAFMRSLSPVQQARATLATRKDSNNNQLEMFRDNEIVPHAGIAASELNEKQKAGLLAVIEEFIGNLRPAHAGIKMDEVRKHLDETRFAWVGETSDDAVFYYRVHSPVVIIEFDHQRPIALGRRGSPPTRDHIHAVVRTPNGNDYGKALLRQHLEKHHSR
ncbi:MAG: DUF3500 domain-containing protein [Verrucomicrobiae bacterium]|nr:DUF3500 domain-containing protein [Verrucomicrobiae bacterium]